MNQFLLFLHFSDLWNLFINVESMFQCYSLLDMKVIWTYYLLLINSFKFIRGYLFFPNKTTYEYDDTIYMIYKSKFEALLETSDKLNSKSNLFSCIIFQCWHNILESFITILYDFEKKWLGSFGWKTIACTTKVYLFSKEEG